MIGLTRPTIAPGMIEALGRVIESNRFSPGSEVKAFEQEWAGYCGMDYGVACNSGTTAIEMAAKALGIQRGDKVLLPAFACLPVATPFVHMGARIGLMDCGEDGNVTESTFQEAIKRHPDATAIVIVHTYGEPVGYGVFSGARNQCLKIIEDCAEAHGVKPQGDIACFSFRGDKMITSGGAGGMPRIM